MSPIWKAWKRGFTAGVESAIVQVRTALDIPPKEKLRLLKVLKALGSNDW